MENFPDSDIPRIEIKKTVANDVYIFLNTLIPTNDIARIIRNYDTFIFDYLAEMRLLSQIVNRSDNGQVKQKQIAGTPIKRLPEKKKFRKITWLSNKGTLLR